MTLDETINNFAEATKNHRYEQQYWLNERDETSPLYEADRFSLADDSRESAEYYEQLAEWLTDYKELKNSIGAVKLSNMKEALELIREYKAENTTLREENKVLIQECDRLIKEKGELLSKVSGGDVLRICQLEEQLQVEIDNSHCLEIELKEAKRLLKMAMEDMKILYESGKDEGCYGIKFKWRYADEALKLIESCIL